MCHGTQDGPTAIQHLGCSKEQPGLFVAYYHIIVLVLFLVIVFSLPLLLSL